MERFSCKAIFMKYRNCGIDSGNISLPDFPMISFRLKNLFSKCLFTSVYLVSMIRPSLFFISSSDI